MIKLLIGGSPCTYWSCAQKNNRETEPSGMGWELFKNYLIAKKKFKPDFFLYENNKSADEAIKQQIRKELEVWDGTFLMEDSGARYIEINSALVSAQNRQRFYVHNCGDVEQPEDKGIKLDDILESGKQFGGYIKSYCLTSTYHKGQPLNKVLENHLNTMVAEMVDDKKYFVKYSQSNQPVKAISVPQNTVYTVYNVRNGLITIRDKQYNVNLKDGYYIIRKLSVTECCRLQTMPDNYCRMVSNKQAYKGLGNGWTAEVIIHILSHALKDIPHDEKILVLSMYDGIGTGRYCLDKMGFTSVEYHAFEIDKYAMQIAMSNYPDIIQHGDAFQVRKENWSLDS